jgi:hypothetical protein
MDGNVASGIEEHTELVSNVRDMVDMIRCQEGY